jgi:hypothetical protein
MTGPARGVVLIRPVQTEECFAGGKIIVPEQVRDKIAADQVQVLEVGPPEICENEACCRPHETTISRNGLSIRVHPTDPRLVDGAWVLVQPRSFVQATEENQYFAKQDDVRAVLSTDVD